MKRSWILLIVAAAALAVGAQAWAQDGLPSRTSWHGYYYDAAWGMPVALVVPPLVRKETNLGWGVPSAREDRIYARFRRGWPGPGNYDRSAFLPAPPWPSDTTQCGVYYVRGPW
jgi:hypothetical protein